MEKSTAFLGGAKIALLRPVLIIMFLLAIGLVFLFSAQVSQRIEDLREVPRDNAQWNLSQLEVDFLKLERAGDAVIDFGLPALDEFRLRYDVFYSRTHLLNESVDAQHIHDNLDLHDLHMSLLNLLKDTVDLVDGDDRALAAAMPTFLEKLRSVGEAPRLLSLGAVRVTAEMSDAQRSEIARLLRQNAVAAIVVLFALIAAVVTLWYQRLELGQRSVEIRQAVRLQNSTLRASLDAIVVIDENGNITDFNGSAESVFGHRKQDVIGKSLGETIVPPELRDSHTKGLSQYTIPANSSIVDKGRIELSALHADGSVFPIEISISETPGATGPNFVSYIRDITDDLKNKLELQNARDEALEAYREKSRFFALMSHEMRTPLNGLVSSLELLKDENLDEKQARYVEIAERSSDVLLGHVNDVLLIETMDADKVERQSVPVNVQAIIDDLSNSMRPLADQQNTVLSATYSGPDIPVTGDERSIRQVLTNLLSNAIKFTSSGRVAIRANMAQVDGENYNLTFDVIDTGVGISKDQVPRIFDDFVTAGSPYERTATGTGLGLGIVRRLVRTMGGTIRCESSEKKGSTFSFSVPVALAAPHQQGTPTVLSAQDTAAPHSTGAMNILLVEDNEINAELLEVMLRKEGHSVSHASDGFEGVHMAGKTHFDLILMDISMPNMNGIKATHEIRASQGLSRLTPIYAVTANAMPDEVHEFEAAGMAGCLLKPIHRVRLLKLLQEVARGASEAAVSDRSAAEAHNFAALDAGQLDELKEILGVEQLRSKMELFRGEGDELSGTLKNACAERDVAALMTIAHKFAGSCATFGAIEIATALRAIETECKLGNLDDACALVDQIDKKWATTTDELFHYLNS